MYASSTEEVCNLEAAESLFVVQEFCETSGGIDGIVNGRHDLEFILLTVSSFYFLCALLRAEVLANTKAGGSIPVLWH